MTSETLRSRIALVILPHCDNYSVAAFRAAEAVIEELGLQQEWGALDAEDGGVLSFTRADLKPGRGETIKTRWITDWQPDDNQEPGAPENENLRDRLVRAAINALHNGDAVVSISVGPNAITLEWGDHQ